MEPADRPPLRSFKPRRRRLGARALAAYEHAGTRLLAEQGPVLDWAEVFGRAAPVVLEIGFGGGESLVERAGREPDRCFVGVEVHQPGIARVLHDVVEFGLGNVRVVEGDALVALERLAPASVAEVVLLFPDPWPKARHVARRIVRPAVLDAFARVLVPGGVLHVATDWADYASHVVAVVGADPRWRGGVVARPDWRVLTRFERRAVADGRLVTDLRYVLGGP